ncbi:MAG: polymorphic toxin type 46 domain-containing protein [Janthinobacterium lividum]
MMPAARLGDNVAHTHAGLGMGLGILAGVVAGAVIVGATVATGGAALAVVAAVGGAAGLISFGGLKGMHIGEASMGPPCGSFVVGSRNVFVNGRPATFTLGSAASCSKESGGPIPLATGSSTVMLNFGLAGREGEKVGCSALSVKRTSPDVFIGGASAQDPRVAIQPEVPGWAVTALEVLGIAGALAALPYSIVCLGVMGTIEITATGMLGSAVGGQAMRSLGRAMGMSEAGVRTIEAAGELGGGMAAGRVGVKGIQSDRRALAQSFYETQGMPAKNIPDHLKGIDFNRPVEVVDLPSNKVLGQSQVPGGRQGNYYTEPGTAPTSVGINPQGTDYNTGAVVDKVETPFTTQGTVPVLKSTAAPVVDNWSVKGVDYPTEGGGTQYFSMTKGSFK